MMLDVVLDKDTCEHLCLHAQLMKRHGGKIHFLACFYYVVICAQNQWGKKLSAIVLSSCALYP